MTIDNANATLGTRLPRRGPTELDGLGFRLEPMDRMPIPQLLSTLPRRWAGRDDPSRGLALASCST
jgi:hypothetical protein